jgi:hypothetical protein
MYTKRGNRISLLPVSRYCGLAAQLSEAHGAGRAAALSTAFHAQAASAPDAKAKLSQLTPKELEQIAGWTKPTPAVVDGQTLTYEDAAKEQAVGLTASGEWADSGEVLTCGTLDFAWVVGGVAYIGDMKKSRWTTSGPDSLQLLTYGWAWAKKHGCHSFCVGLWIIEDAEWQWSSKVYSVVDFDSLDLWSTIAHAANNNDGQANFGGHCSDCYGRLHCPEYTAPASLAETVLAPAVAGGSIDDPLKLAELYAFCERVEGLIEKVKDQAKEAARRGVTLVHPVSGKVLQFTACKGRESLNQARLFEELPEAKRFVERGQGYSRAAWVKPKAVK